METNKLTTEEMAAFKKWLGEEGIRYFRHLLGLKGTVVPVLKLNKMNHDLIHCDGFECPLKERCVRYKAHLDLKENEYNGLYDYYVILPYDKKTKSCKRFKKIE